MNKQMTVVVSGLLLLGVISSVSAQQRDQISIVGSSTVFPFSTVVAEKFGRASKFKAPKVESTGSGGGIKLFCQGIGAKYPDITNSSRRIKKSEVEQCAQNGVTEIVEVLIGYDGIVLANAKEAAVMKLSLRDVYLALAKEVPDPKQEGKVIANPHKTWQDIDKNLPKKAIEVLGPPPTSGTRDAFVELAMEGGCQTVSWIKALEKENKDRYKQLCHNIREDGAFIEAGENDNLIVQKLNANPDALGIFGFSFLDQNVDKVQGSVIDGHAPTFEAIAEGDYPVSRPLYFYVKKAHIGQIAGMAQYLEEFTSEKAWGEDGYLAEKGMIPLPQAKRAEVKKAVSGLQALQL